MPYCHMSTMWSVQLYLYWLLCNSLKCADSVMPTWANMLLQHTHNDIAA